jgi:hypothetical protein
VIPRRKFFAWLLLNGKLNSKEMTKKKNFFVEFSECTLCNSNTEESIVHLFFECSLSLLVGSWIWMGHRLWFE